MLRDEVGLERGLAKLKSEVAEARQQAPSFKAELEGLRAEVATQEKTISRLRAEQSQLGFGLRQTDKRMTLTTFELTAVGGATREALERRTGGNQHVTVKHIHQQVNVTEGGQAVVAGDTVTRGQGERRRGG